jgi:uracil-DNA glycosylase
MDLYTNIKNNVPPGWEELFRIADPEIQQISDILEKEKTKGFRIVPDMENIFRVFYMCRPENIKVIIYGQDCYHQILSNGKPRAQGFSFSVNKEDAIPSSLHNIYKEIKNNYPNAIIPNHGDISHWVSQGVFLLNANLTCRVNEPGSHAKYKLWMPFMDRFLKFLSSVNKNVIFLLWGKDAQQLEDAIEKSFKNILKSAHPSGLSASRGFFGCGHFKKVNEMIGNDITIKWLEMEPTPIELYLKYFAQEIDRKEMEEITYHYKDYYNSKELSLNEYSIMMLLIGIYNCSSKQIPFEEFLKNVRFNFENKNKKDFHKCVYNT